MSSLELKALASAVLAVVGVVLTVIGRRLGRSDARFDNTLVIGMLLLVIWVPREYRDVGISCMAGLIGLLSGIAVAIACGFGTFALASVVPGGVTVVLLGLGALFAIFIAIEERGHLRDVRRAKMLVPGENSQDRVAIVGPCSGRAERPDTGDDVAAWWLEVYAAGRPDAPLAKSASKGRITVESSDGVAHVELEDVVLERAHIGVKQLKGDEAAALARQLGSNAKGELEATVAWLEPGTSLLVTGVPTWEARRDAGGYRHTEFVPVFRASEKTPLSVRVGTLESIKQRFKYAALMWCAWSAPCVGIAVLQLGSWV